MRNLSDNRAAILVFAKTPTPGRVKTRLTPKFSPEEAAAIHRACLVDVLRTVAGLPRNTEKWIFFAGSPAAVRKLKRTLVPHNVSVGLQAGGNLGRRLVIALQAFFRSGVNRLVVIGTDTPWLSRKRVLAALRLLSRNDVVLGPTEDGGYYLIACRRLIPEMFSHIAWGSDRVMAQTKSRLRTLGVRFHLLPVDFDLDRPEDLERCWRKLTPISSGLALNRPRGRRPAPTLSSVLRLLRPARSRAEEREPSRSNRPQ